MISGNIYWTLLGFSNALKCCISVDLPLPVCPIKAMNLLSANSKETLSSPFFFHCCSWRINIIYFFEFNWHKYCFNSSFVCTSFGIVMPNWFNLYINLSTKGISNQFAAASLFDWKFLLAMLVLIFFRHLAQWHYLPYQLHRYHA